MKEKIKEFLHNDRFTGILLYFLYCVLATLGLLLLICGIGLWFGAGPWIIKVVFSIFFILTSIATETSVVWLFTHPC